MMHLVVLVEERSMKVVLETILPQVLPPDAAFRIVPFEGKGDLMNGIPVKLRGWNDPQARFLIVRDQDRLDCHDVKEEVLAEVAKTGKAALVRIVCRELESWYFGDLEAVSQAYGKDFTGYANKRGYRDPDTIHDVKKKFLKMVPNHQQIEGAKKIAPHMGLERNRSRSFNALISGVQKLVDDGALTP